MTIEAELQQAIHHHQANQLEQAEQCYRSILLAEPDHPDANHNFGVLALQRGQLDEGLSRLRSAVSAAPQRRNFWVSYIEVLAQSGRHDDAQRASDDARQHGFVVRAGGTEAASADAATQEAPDAIDTLTAQGRHDEAEALARQLVAANPAHGPAWKALAHAQLRRGDLGAALAPLEKATALLPGDAELDRHLHAARAMHVGLTLEANAEYAKAAECFQAVLETYPHHPDANHHLAILAIRLHEPDKAIPLLEKALGVNPNNLQYWAHYIDALFQADRLPAAWVALNMAQKRGLAGPQIDRLIGIMTAVPARKMVKVAQPVAPATSVTPAVSPDPKGAAKPSGAAPAPARDLTAKEENHLRALAKTFNDGDVEAALKNARAEIQRLPWHGFPRKVEALSLHRLGRYDETLESALKAQELWPEDTDVLLIVAGLHQMRHKLREAAAACERLLKVQPDHGEGLRLMGVIKLDLGELDLAEQFGRRALEAAATALAFNSLGVTLMKQGRLDEAAEMFERGTELDPSNELPFNNLAFCLTHSERPTPAEVFAAHRRFAAQFEAPLKPHWRAHANSKEPDRQLRIGFISGDFNHHAVSSFLEPVLGPLGQDPGLSLHAYSNTTIIDEVTDRMRGLFPHWTSVVGMSAEAAAAQIRADGIDILIDLAGHTAQNRLATLAHKPAPLQASWIGYPGTTGLDATDYFLADRFWVPNDQFRDQFTEKIVYLPAVAPFQPEQLSPPVNLLPASHNGYVTFGSFNRLDKLRRDVIALWAQLLRTMPDARLVIGAMPSDGGTGNLAKWFEEEGIASDRISYRPRAVVPVYLQQHHQVDICLDSFPFSGLTTAFHSLWMGLPTITLPAHTVPGRSGLTAMSHVGLTQCIAEDKDDYIRKAVALASDLPALAALRSSMRGRCLASPVFQPERLAKSVSLALRVMWQRWCAGLPPESLDVSSTS